MSWCDGSDDNYDDLNQERGSNSEHPPIQIQHKDQSQSCVTSGSHSKIIVESPLMTCPSCGHKIQVGRSIKDLPSLPAGVKFDPSDKEILMHLEAKVSSHDDNPKKLHPLIDEFIPTLQGENGICYTHPEKLPGVSKDGQVRHFFHRPSKAYTTGTRKRRKVSTDEQGHETRWHKTGKTRPILSQSSSGQAAGFKKILVLYTNYGRQKKPEKTNWVMHQYHLGHSEDEKDGETVLSKVFYQTHPRQCAASTLTKPNNNRFNLNRFNYENLQVGFGYEHEHGPKTDDVIRDREGDDGSCSFLTFTCDASKGKERFMKNQ